MKRAAVLMVSLALVIFSVPALNAQVETGNIETQGIQTDSTEQGTTGTTESAPGTEQPASTSSQSETSGMNTYQMSSSTAAVQDLSRLDEDPTPEVSNEFRSIAEERANELVSKLGLEPGKADRIRAGIMDYFVNYWESRVSLDKENNDPDNVREHNADLANQRVDLIEDIEDELTEDQINQFRSFKVDWWKSLDIALFDVQQGAVTSSLARDNEKGSDEQQ
jgi:hypothetical protein